MAFTDDGVCFKSGAFVYPISNQFQAYTEFNIPLKQSHHLSNKHKNMLIGSNVWNVAFNIIQLHQFKHGTNVTCI